jgi:membrane-bound ClpP family serine protease
MVVAGLVLVIIAVLLVLAGLFGGGSQTVTLDLGAFSLDMSPAALFLFGIASMLVLAIGLGIMRVGARRARAHRQDRKKVDELSRKLDEAKSERDTEVGDRDRPARG